MAPRVAILPGPWASVLRESFQSFSAVLCNRNVAHAACVISDCLAATLKEYKEQVEFVSII